MYNNQQLEDYLSLKQLNVCVVALGTQYSYREHTNSHLELYLRKVLVGDLSYSIFAYFVQIRRVHVLEPEKQRWISARSTDTIAAVKAKFTKYNHIPVEDVVLHKGSIVLENDKTLGFYGINSTNPNLTLSESSIQVCQHDEMNLAYIF